MSLLKGHEAKVAAYVTLLRQNSGGGGVEGTLSNELQVVLKQIIAQIRRFQPDMCDEITKHLNRDHGGSFDIDLVERSHTLSWHFHQVCRAHTNR